MPTENAGINALTESIALRSDATDKFIAANTKAQAENTRAIAQLGTKIDKLSETVANQTSSIERLERGIDKLVAGIHEQREGIDRMVSQQSEFLKLCTRQADIIENLTKGNAA
ncbi:MAG: hypothetical protein AAGJ80_00070 [Cyanobacteria bacterium J06553_1]